MPITVIVRSATGDETRLTFDGTQRIAIGRAAGCDVRLPDATVSHRHASLRAHGANFVLIDEESTNGTFVGGVPIAARTSRIVRSGDQIRLGRVWIEIRIDHSAITRDVAVATRDLALSLVAQFMATRGDDITTKICVVEGRDQGSTLRLAQQDRFYIVGRGAECDLALSDPDASRQHVRVVRRRTVVQVQDLGAKNGVWVGDARPSPGIDVVWRSHQVVRVGSTVLSLVEPVGNALTAIESAPDEAIAPNADLPAPPPPAENNRALTSSPDSPTSGDATKESAAPNAANGGRKKKGSADTWSLTDILVMTAALCLLLLSIAGLVWLLHG
jgi:pSer/pThr/pTyr-binding forkhead associated (FHA) protein